MKQLFHKALSFLLSLSLLTLPSAASDALGEDLTSNHVELNRETQLSTNVFWSSAYSDLRQEHYITYIPNETVTPMVLSGDVLTQRTTVTTAARELEASGYRVVAGINGDFYNVNTGLPIGIVISEGTLRSSDAGHYAIGFRADGTAILGKPAVKVTADLGYGVDDGSGYVQYMRSVQGINKARVSTGGIFLYTYDFNDRHTTGNTEPGVDVVCTVADGALSIGDTLTLTVEQVLEAESATTIEPDQVILSVNTKSDPYYVNALRNIPVGATVTLNITSADEGWNDVEYAVGALYNLVENGQVVPDLQAGVNPRTAIGQKADGTLIFYTIDGRRSGHSIGASMTQVGQRLIELGCVSAVCLDGGGSTTLSVTAPDALESQTLNRPSDGRERAVTNQIFLVADNQPSGQLSHFYVEPDSAYVLAGSRVHISTAAIDTNYIPMDRSYTLSTSAGTLDGDILTTPTHSDEVTVTASGGGKTGSATIYTVETPDYVAIRNNGGALLEELTVVPGSTTTLTATAAYRHLSLTADPECFRWSVSGNIGTIDAAGKFTAGTPGTGSITVSAGDTSATIGVTVSKLSLQTLEDFEESHGSIWAQPGGIPAWSTSGELVRLGKGSLEFSYAGLSAEAASIGANYALPAHYTQLNLWLKGDGSGNALYLHTTDGEIIARTLIATLDNTDWTLCSVALPAGATAITGLSVEGTMTETIDSDTGELVNSLLTPENGTIYLDHLVASYGGITDEIPPAVKLETGEENLTASIADAVDGVPPQTAVSVTRDGMEQIFLYDQTTGVLKTPLISDGLPHRITVTARDASGNIGRASYDIPPVDAVHRFTDIEGYWAADYVDFLYDANITTGYADGSFRPNQSITRAQFSVMLYRYLGLNEADYAAVELPFADMAAIPEYAIPGIRALYSEGIINGTTGKDGRLYFNPGSSLTRAQAATMIGRTQEKGYATVELTFTDAGQIPAYAAYYIQTMAAQGVLGGYADGSFKPNTSITRGQMAKILYTLM